jgi:hypothetical protein
MMKTHRMYAVVVAIALASPVAGLAQEREGVSLQARDAIVQAAAGEAVKREAQDSIRQTKAVEGNAVPSADSGLAPRPADRDERVSRTDRLELDTTVVTGNKELPKVLYIVPWKKAGIGDLPAQPFNTLLDEALMPVDRDVFRREVTYYDALSSGGDTPAGALDVAGPSAGKAADGSEK